MIGSARTLGVLTVLALGAGLCLRPAAASAADPPLEVARAGAVRAAAAEAGARLAALSTAVDLARDAARRGAALVVSGDQDPAPELLAAASALEAGAEPATAAQAAMRRLAGVMAAVRPADPPPALEVAAPALLAIAGQLRGSTDAATAFVARRTASAETLDALGRALAALDAGELDTAEAAIADARAARTVVGDWATPPPELSIWLGTTGAMLDAAEGILAAARAGDDAALADAAAAYRDAAADAALADRALTLAISEGGAAVTSAALVLLAGALENVAAAEDALAALAAA